MLRPLLCTALVLSLSTLTHAQDWSQFRGSDGLCVADETPIPTNFGPETAVVWKTAIAAGHSSPCIVGERIFVTGSADGKNVLTALDRGTGEELWSKTFEGEGQAMYFHPDAVPGLPTPVSDGERVIAYFANYGLVAVDVEGELQWEKRMPLPGYGFGVGSSPLLYDGILVLPRDGAPEAAILALRADDGSELWKIDRFGFGESHGTPFLWRNADRGELIVGGTNKLCSFNPGTGEPLWTVDGLTNFPCTTPTADADTLYYAAWSTPNASGRSFWEGAFSRSLELSDEEVADPQLLFKRLDANGDGKVVPDEVPECRAKDAFGFIDGNRSGAWEVQEIIEADAPNNTPGRNMMVAVARGAEGDATKDGVRWTWTRGLPYVSSPLLYRGRIWLFKSGGLVTVLDAESGKAVINRKRLEDRSEYYMSPVGAAGHVLVASAEGTFYLIDADADELTIEHSVTFPEELFATPAVIDGKIYLRSKSTMWVFGEATE